jgi:hypothetical protein
MGAFMMYWPDTIGASPRSIARSRPDQQYGPRWAPSPLSRRLAEAGTPLREAKLSRPM